MKISPRDIKKYNQLSRARKSPMALIDGQWYSWEEGDAKTGYAWVADQDGEDKEVQINNIEQISEAKKPSKPLDYDRGEEMLGQIVKKYPVGKKRTFMLKQVLHAVFKTFPSKKIGTQRINGLILQFNLDQNDNIPLWRI